MLAASIMLSVRSGEAFAFSSDVDPADSATDIVLEAAAEDARGGVWTPDPRSADAPNVALPRRTSSEDGAFTLLGDRIRATVKRTRPSDPGLGLADAASSGGEDASHSYRLEADIIRRGEVGLSAYGDYRQATAHAAADGFERDAATAGLNLGVGKWRSWIERRESPDDVAMNHISNATRMLTYSSGIAFGPATSAERLRIGVSHSEPTAQADVTAEYPLQQPSQEIRRALEVSLGQRWQVGTTRLQLGRSITGATNSPNETESSARVAHQLTSGPWRGEAAFGFSAVRDDRPADAFEKYAYEISARITYVADGVPDLSARMSHGEAIKDSLTSDQTDVDATWQVSGTIGFGKLLSGTTREPSRFLDLNFGVGRDDAMAALDGETIAATIGVAAGLRF